MASIDTRFGGNFNLKHRNSTVFRPWDPEFDNRLPVDLNAGWGVPNTEAMNRVAGKLGLPAGASTTLMAVLAAIQTFNPGITPDNDSPGINPATYSTDLFAQVGSNITLDNIAKMFTPKSAFAQENRSLKDAALGENQDEEKPVLEEIVPDNILISNGQTRDPLTDHTYGIILGNGMKVDVFGLRQVDKSTHYTTNQFYKDFMDSANGLLPPNSSERARMIDSLIKNFLRLQENIDSYILDYVSGGKTDYDSNEKEIAGQISDAIGDKLSKGIDQFISHLGELKGNHISMDIEEPELPKVEKKLEVEKPQPELSEKIEQFEKKIIEWTEGGMSDIDEYAMSHGHDSTGYFFYLSEYFNEDGTKKLASGTIIDHLNNKINGEFLLLQKQITEWAPEYDETVITYSDVVLILNNEIYSQIYKGKEKTPDHWDAKGDSLIPTKLPKRFKVYTHLNDDQWKEYGLEDTKIKKLFDTIAKHSTTFQAMVAYYNLVGLTEEQKKEILDKNDKIEKLSQVAEASGIKYEDLQTEFDSLMALNLLTQEQQEQLKQEMKSQKLDYLGKVNFWQGQSDQLFTENQDYVTKIQLINQAFAEEKQELIKGLEGWKAALDEATTKITGQRGTIGDQQTRINDLTQNLEQYKTNLKDREGTITNLQTEINLAYNTVEAKGLEIQDLQTELTEAEELSQAQRNSLNTRLSTLQEQYSQLTSEHNDFKTRYQTEIKGYEDKVEELELTHFSEVERFQGELNIYAERTRTDSLTIVNNQRVIKDNQGRIHNLEGRVTVLTRNKTSLEEDNRDLQEDKEKLQDELGKQYADLHGAFSTGVLFNGVYQLSGIGFSVENIKKLTEELGFGLKGMLYIPVAGEDVWSEINKKPPQNLAGLERWQTVYTDFKETLSPGVGISAVVSNYPLSGEFGLIYLNGTRARKKTSQLHFASGTSKSPDIITLPEEDAAHLMLNGGITFYPFHGRHGINLSAVYDLSSKELGGKVAYQILFGKKSE